MFSILNNDETATSSSENDKDEENQYETIDVKLCDVLNQMR
jgi:hypothetical protein